MPLPQMQPVGQDGRRRPGSPSQRSEDGGSRPFCFPGSDLLFGGCQICSVDDGEFKERGFRRLRGGGQQWVWLNGADALCATDSRSKNAVQDCVEDVEGTSLGNEDSEDESYTEDNGGPPTAAPMVPQHDSGNIQCRNPEEAALQQEVEALLWSAGDVFAQKGWELGPIGGGRYRLNGRGIKLSLLPVGAPLPYFTHIAPVLGFDVAERAARLTVCDGSLRQPLLDYLLATGQNESYDQRGTENVMGVSGAGQFLDFNVAETGDRLIEMKHATIQAAIRRRAGGGAEAPGMTALQADGAKLLEVRPGGRLGGSRCSSRAGSQPPVVN